MNRNTKLGLIAISIVSLLVMDTVSAAEIAGINKSIYDGEFSKGGFLDSFIGYYKSMSFWMTLLNILVSLFIGLAMVSAADKDSRSKWKQALVNVNISYFIFILLGGISSLTIGVVLPKTADLSTVNKSISFGTAFDDKSPTIAVSSSQGQKDLVDGSSNLILAKDSIRKELQQSVDSKKLNEYLTAYSNVYSAMLAMKNTTQDINNFGSLKTTYADSTKVQSISEKLNQAKITNGPDGKPLVTDKDISLFNELMRNTKITSEGNLDNAPKEF